MKDNYKLEVDFDVFERIMQGKCSYIALLNDKARKAYKKGNLIDLETVISAENGDKKTESVKAEIINLLYFQTVKELVDMVGKENIGYTKSATKDKIEDVMTLNYSNEDIEKFGLVAVYFELR